MFCPPLTFSAFGIRNSQSVQNSSVFAEFLHEKLFKRLKCNVAPFFTLERCNWVVFCKHFRPNIRETLIFRPKLKSLKGCLRFCYGGNDLHLVVLKMQNFWNGGSDDDQTCIGAHYHGSYMTFLDKVWLLVT